MNNAKFCKAACDFYAWYDPFGFMDRFGAPSDSEAIHAFYALIDGVDALEAELKNLSEILLDIMNELAEDPTDGSFISCFDHCTKAITEGYNLLEYYCKGEMV